MALVQFGERLRTVMEQRGETPQSIAQKLDITPQAVHKWMRGTAEITLSNLRALAQHLNVNWLWLRYGDNVVMELAPPTHRADPVEQYRHQLIGGLVEAERRRRWAFELLGIGMYEVDVLTDQRYWGPAFRRMLHIPLDMPATVDNLAAALTPESAQNVASAAQRCLLTCQRQWGQGRVAVNPNEILEFMIEPTADAEGRVVRLSGLVRPVRSGQATLREFVEGYVGREVIEL